MRVSASRVRHPRLDITCSRHCTQSDAKRPPQTEGKPKNQLLAAEPRACNNDTKPKTKNSPPLRR
jgi:hypothetical protein